MKRSALLLLLLWSFVAPASPFEIERAELDFDQDTLIFSAKIAYRFPPKVQEALRHGVPITTLLEITLFQKFWPIWRKRLAFRLEFSPLTDVYRVVDLEKGIQRGFSSLEEATRALGELEELVFSLPERRWRQVDRAEIRVFLDRSRLPWPLWLPTLFDPEWRPTSPTYRWSPKGRKTIGAGGWMGHGRDSGCHSNS